MAQRLGCPRSSRGVQSSGRDAGLRRSADRCAGAAAKVTLAHTGERTSEQTRTVVARRAGGCGRLQKPNKCPNNVESHCASGSGPGALFSTFSHVSRFLTRVSRWARALTSWQVLRAENLPFSASFQIYGLFLNWATHSAAGAYPFNDRGCVFRPSL